MMPTRTPSLDALLSDRGTRQAACQDAAYAKRFEDFVREMATVENNRFGSDRIAHSPSARATAVAGL